DGTAMGLDGIAVQGDDQRAGADRRLLLETGDQVVQGCKAAHDGTGSGQSPDYTCTPGGLAIAAQCDIHAPASPLGLKPESPMRGRAGSTSASGGPSTSAVMQRWARAWYSAVPRCFQATSCSVSGRLTTAGDPTTRLCSAHMKPALTNAVAATMQRGAMCAPSMTTAFMPTRASSPTRQPCRTAPWPTWPLRSTTVSPPGKPCITHVS